MKNHKDFWEKNVRALLVRESNPGPFVFAMDALPAELMVPMHIFFPIVPLYDAAGWSGHRIPYSNVMEHKFNEYQL